MVFVFGNALIVLLTRSGKMWMLSMLLIVVSFIYLYRAVTEETKQGRPGALSAVSIVSAFLATANFAFAGLFLVNIPILWYVFPRTFAVLRRLALYTAAGAAIFLAVFALNVSNILEQVSGFVLQFFGSAAGGDSVQAALTPLESFLVNARHAVEAFPLLLLALIPAILSGIRDRTLAYLSMIYIAIYIIAVAVIFRTDHGLALNVRHIAPIGFFLLFLLASFRPPARFVSFSFLLVGLAVYAYTLVLLSIPTTYNAAYDFLVHHYGDKEIRIDEHIFELTLPMNKASYALYRDESCGSTCRHTQALEHDIAFRPLVVTGETDPALALALPPPDLVVVERRVEDCVPLARFGNDVSDDEVFDIDINLGRMLMPSFYTLTSLGKNIYIYDAKECPTDFHATP